VKENFWSTKPPGIVWLKLKENDDVPAATYTGVKPEVKLTPPAVLTQVIPQVISKLSDGLIVDAPTIRTTTFTVEDNGFATMAVQL
jgi:hypothetical protein